VLFPPRTGHRCGAFLRMHSFLPQQRDTLQLSFALADPRQLERMFASAGFTDVQIERETREDTMESFDEYWAPIEAGTGLKVGRLGSTT
jgi:hypothetical protein